MKPFSDRLAGVDRRSAGLPPVKRSEGAEPGAFPRIAGLPAGDYCVITPYLLPPGSPKAVNIGDGFILDSAIRLIGKKPCALYSSRAPLNASDITRINESSALLIAGANTLKDRFEITPGFDLHLLDRIKVPVMLMGLGHYGDPKATAHGLNRESSGLLRAILERFPLMSVRCDASQKYVMAALPEMAERVLMTSCPVAYTVDQVNRRFDASRALTNVVVTITDRTRIDEQLWMLAFAKARFPALHHTLALHQDHGNQPLWRHAEKLGYRVFRSARYEDFIDLYASADLHFGNRVHGHLKCLAMGICSYLAPFDLRHRFFAESLDFPLIAQGGTDEFRTYRFDRFLQARQAAAGSMVRFIAAVRSTLK
jgi:hypothetical protein